MVLPTPHEAGSRNTRMKVLVLALHTGDPAVRGRCRPHLKVCARRAGAWAQEHSLMTQCFGRRPWCVGSKESGQGSCIRTWWPPDPVSAPIGFPWWPSSPTKYPSVYGCHGKQSEERCHFRGAGQQTKAMEKKRYLSRSTMFLETSMP